MIIANFPTGKTTPASIGAIPVTEKGVSDGVATLGSDGILTESQRPTYTADDVGAIQASLKGALNGVAELDGTGRVPSSQLPSYVDDVLEFSSQTGFPPTGEDGKIYVAEDTNRQYRWSGSQYVEISASLALGETESTAYRGDRGKTAYDHSQVTQGNPHGTTAGDVGAVPVGRTINGKDLGEDIALNAGDVGALTQTVADQRYLALSGGTMAGSLTLHGDPTSANHAANKNYVDNHIASIPLASASVNGLMASSDKKKLDAYAPTQIFISAENAKPGVVNGAILITYEA